ncbi:MAG: DAK2 domain-containing protein [Oscillospiraceae bacterium]|nr:DAK2 domain-containing protein [Oscillospiraceae bacterium]
MIQGQILRDAIISGAHQIARCKQQVDELNVFPVPDGDTGTNMSMTIGSAVRELERQEDGAGVGEIAKIAAAALLRGARGNSGVILSLLFRGFAKGLEGKKEAGAADFVEALSLGVAAAYKAVMKPTEGTILTVAREAAEQAKAYLAEHPDTTPQEIFNRLHDYACASLEKTPELLPVLKKAGVVDAGGKGFIVILEGMLSVFNDGVIVGAGEAAAKPQQRESKSGKKKSEVLADFEFKYCTEFIINRENEADPLSLRAYLESIGDSVVVVDDEEIIKVHVHTNNPGNALQEGLKFGMLSNMKIENMWEQFLKNESVYVAEKPEEPEGPEEELAYAVPEEGIGFVAVAAGAGIEQLFFDLGVSHVVRGGQTMNPSTDDILKAVQATPAKTVFVLPNNKNIIMAAEQAQPLADRKVRVLQTRSIPEGISAMLAYDPEQGAEENHLAMIRAYEQVMTGQITFAARDSDFDGHKIKEGEILALSGGKLAFTEKDICRAAVKLTRSLVKREASFVTVLYGQDVTAEEAGEMAEQLRERLPDGVELNLVDGGQPVYYYIISVE